MKSATKRLAIVALSVAFVGFLSAGSVEACYQAPTASVQLRSKAISGTITLNGKPIEASRASLHKFLDPYLIEMNHVDSRVLIGAVTAKDGHFRFGEVPSGKYVVILERTNEATIITLTQPKARENDTVEITVINDSCGDATAISANGERLPSQFSPAILEAPYLTGLFR